MTIVDLNLVLNQYYNEDNSFSLASDSQAWVLGADSSDDKYANVQLAINLDAEGDEIRVSNFGGMIGYWNSPLQFSGPLDNELVNMNGVLTFEGVDADIQIAAKATEKEDGKHNLVISNVGGIVGCSRASIDNLAYGGQIGQAVQDVPIVFTSLDSTFQLVNVGGIVGCIREDNRTITDCYTLSAISGMYGVGGIVGKAGIITVEYTDTDKMETMMNSTGAEVIGLADIGGIIGSATQFVYSTVAGDSINYLIEQVVGIVNVGGIVGVAIDSVEMSNVIVGNEPGPAATALSDSLKKVVGNMNVGGLVGYSGNIQLVDVKICENIGVYGNLFDYQNATTLESSYNKACIFIPTNIGGVLGQVDDESTIMNFTEVETHAFVGTTDETISTTYDIGINMAKNYCGKTTINDENIYVTNSGALQYLKWYYVASNIANQERERYVNYDVVDGGIGGFAGKLSTNNSFPTFVNCIVGGRVFAPQGINVGGIVGAVKGNADPVDWELPKIDTNIVTGLNVAGKIFVGGYIGKTSSGISGLKLQPKSAINVQQYVDENGETKVLEGSCVGGIIGYVNGNVSGIHVTNEFILEDGSSSIKVFNADKEDNVKSSNVGTLMGSIYGIMTQCSIIPELCDAVAEGVYYKPEYGTIKGIIQEPTEYNYGGLVGLANIPADQYNSTQKGNYTIIGTHYYAFTVDLLQNQDYYNYGVSKYSYSDEVLVATAHYINASNIEISPTGLTSLYAKGNANNKNPIISESIGWAKEYTMFRSMARVIPQSGENVVGDAVQVIYSADYISGVYTKFTSDANGRNLSEDIIYTIYQPVGQTPRLYCRYGIAEMQDRFDCAARNGTDDLGISAGVGAGNFEYEFNYPVSVSQSGVWSSSGGTERNAFYAHIDMNEIEIDANAVKVNDDGSFKIGESVDDDVNKALDPYNLTFGYTYFAPGDETSLPGRGHIFVFTTVFDYLGNNDEAMYSKSGSIFEVSGTAYTPETGAIKDGEAWIKWLIIGILIVVGAAFTGGATLYGAIGSAAAGGLVSVSTAATYTIFGISLTSKGLLALAGSLTLMAAGSNMAWDAIGSAAPVANVHFANIESSAMGFLTPTYARTIEWQNYVSQHTADSVIFIDYVVYENGTGTDDDEIIMVPYNLYTSARYIPGDINAKTKLEEDEVAALLGKHSAKSMEIPTYVKIDNDLYCYAFTKSGGKLLYSNYEDNLDRQKDNNSYYGKYLANISGYAYVLKGFANLDSGTEYASDDTWLMDNYNVHASNTVPVNHSLISHTEGIPGIGNDPNNDWDTLTYDTPLTASQKSEIRWRVSELLMAKGVNANNETFTYNRAFYHRSDEDSDWARYADRYHITKIITSVEEDSNTGFKKYGFTVSGGGTQRILYAIGNYDLNVGDTLDLYPYAVGDKTSNGIPSVSLLLAPESSTALLSPGSDITDLEDIDLYNDGITIRGMIDNNILASGIVNNVQQYYKYNQPMYYILDPDGDFKVSRTMVLSKYTALLGDSYGQFNKEPIVIDKYNNLEFYLYGADGTPATGKITHAKLLDNYQSYSNYYLDPYKMQLVDYMYGIETNAENQKELYYKNRKGLFSVDEKGYYYVGIPNGGDFLNLTNRYAHKFTNNNKTYTLYTRFKYGSDDEFFKADIIIGDGNNTGKVYSYLLPQNSGAVGGVSACKFAENARISLSCEGRTIYTNYAPGNSMTRNPTGFIKCGSVPN